MSELAFFLWKHKCVFITLETCVCVGENSLESKFNYLRVKRCRRRISAVCVHKDDQWSVVENSLVCKKERFCSLNLVLKSRPVCPTYAFPQSGQVSS